MRNKHVLQAALAACALACGHAAFAANNQLTGQVITGQPVTAVSAEVPIPTVSLLPGTTTSYLDWTGAGTLASAGVLQGLLTTGQNTVYGDDAHMNTTGLLGSMGFSIANTNPTGSGALFGVVQGNIQFFRQSDNSSIGGFNWNIDFTSGGTSAGLPEQSSSRVSFPDGSLESLGLILNTPDIYVTTTFTTVNELTGLGDPNAVGIQIRNPAGGTAAPVASSADKMILNGTVTNSPFANNPGGNSSYFIRLSPVPEPTSIALVALGGFGAARRRRSSR